MLYPESPKVNLRRNIMQNYRIFVLFELTLCCQTVRPSGKAERAGVGLGKGFYFKGGLRSTDYIGRDSGLVYGSSHHVSNFQLVMASRELQLSFLGRPAQINHRLCPWAAIEAGWPSMDSLCFLAQCPRLSHWPMFVVLSCWGLPDSKQLAEP